MKVTELMLGDWVCTESDSVPRQIDFIRTGEVGLYWNKVATPPYLKPIPLTSEILKRNGFKRQDRGTNSRRFIKAYWKIANQAYMSECSTKKDDTFFILHVIGKSKINDIRYVHQLQHALRLCGIEKEIEL